MEIKRLKPDEFLGLKSWYEQAGDTTMLDMVPLDTAWCVFDGDVPVAVGALEFTNGPSVYIQALQTNKSLPELTQGKGVKMLIDAFQGISRDAGYKNVWGIVAEDHFTLARFYLRQGGLMGRKLMRIFFKKL